jgi:glycosyltransferase involved in cell wall biosynthesis
LPARVSGATEIRPLVLIDTLAQGGAEHSLAALLPRLVDHSVRASILCRYRSPNHLEPDLRAAGIAVEYLPDPSPPKAVVALRQRLRRDRPSLIHANLVTPTCIAAAATTRSGVPLLVSLVNTPEEENPAVAPWKLSAVRVVGGVVYRRWATAVHVVTPGVGESTVSTFRVPSSRILLAERGRDEERFRPPLAGEREAARRDLGVGDDEILVTAVARHVHQKGLDVLVEAVDRVAEESPSVRLLIAGREGPVTPRLRSAIKAMGSKADVSLLGDTPLVPELLRATDVFVLSSRREGAAGAVIEAMATGVPVVATDVLGLRGVTVDGVNSLVTPIDDAGALGDAIVRVARDPDLARRLGDRARADFLARFTLDRAAVALAEVYEEATRLGCRPLTGRRPRTTR